MIFAAIAVVALILWLGARFDALQRHSQDSTREWRRLRAIDAQEVTRRNERSWRDH